MFLASRPKHINVKSFSREITFSHNRYQQKHAAMKTIILPDKCDNGQSRKRGDRVTVTLTHYLQDETILGESDIT